MNNFDVPLDHKTLLCLARTLWRQDPNNKRSTKSEDRSFRELFGIALEPAVSTWNLMIKSEYLPKGGTPYHFLWTLMFLKVYGSEEQMCILANIKDPKTFRKWVWKFIPAISSLESMILQYEYKQIVLRLPFLTILFVDCLV